MYVNTIGLLRRFRSDPIRSGSALGAQPGRSRMSLVPNSAGAGAGKAGRWAPISGLSLSPTPSSVYIWDPIVDEVASNSSRPKPVKDLRSISINFDQRSVAIFIGIPVKSGSDPRQNHARIRDNAPWKQARSFKSERNIPWTCVSYGRYRGRKPRARWATITNVRTYVSRVR